MKKCLGSMVSASRVVASGWLGVSVVVSRAGQGRPVIEGILTCVIDRGEHSLERTIALCYDFPPPIVLF